MNKKIFIRVNENNPEIKFLNQWLGGRIETENGFKVKK